MSSLEQSVISGMARALFVVAWAERELEQGRTYPGQELFTVAPETPASARDAALKLAGRLEEANLVHLLTLLHRAATADGHPEDLGQLPEGYAEEFGHGLALQALGTGAGWFDSHARFPLAVPVYEYQADELADLATCEDCDDRGWGHYTSGYGPEIQRCDSCRKYPTDENAVLAHRAECGCDWPEVAPARLNVNPCAGA